MSINFLDPKLMPKVTCSSPATENYEASNLISENGAVRARGFLAYTVIKPPVELEFEFLCPINVSYIRLNVSVGALRCTGIEVFAKNSLNPYRSIAKGVFDKSVVTFCSSRKYSKAEPPPHSDDSQELFFFKRDTFRLFCDTSAIKIVIFRTQRCVPCLGAIRVFGEPSRSCSKTTVETIKRLMGLMVPPLSHHTHPKQPISQGGPLKVPEDFKDALTCEIMAIPMTLPSGKTIDRDTLEKHLDSEKSFGRKPGDPFTGLKFTDTRKPVLNVALKSRIDMFLLQNCDDPVTRGVKRTLGAPLSSKKRRKSVSGGPSDCCVVCGDGEILYEIPCAHFYCRTCLLGALETFKCDKCGQGFEKNEPKRYYR